MKEPQAERSTKESERRTGHESENRKASGADHQDEKSTGERRPSPGPEAHEAAVCLWTVAESTQGEVAAECELVAREGEVSQSKGVESCAEWHECSAGALGPCEVKTIPVAELPRPPLRWEADQQQGEDPRG